MRVVGTVNILHQSYPRDQFVCCLVDGIGIQPLAPNGYRICGVGASGSHPRIGDCRVGECGSTLYLNVALSTAQSRNVIGKRMFRRAHRAASISDLAKPRHNF